MEIRNTIDVQQLKVTPQDADNTYLGIDENGQLIRTRIELSGTGGGDVNLDDYYTKAEVDTKITDTEQEINTKQDIITDLDTIRGGAAKGAIAFGDYNNIKKNIYDVQEDVSAVQEDVNNIVTNKWELKSGDKTIAGNYGTYTVGDLKTINGQSLIGTEDIVIEGGSGGGTIVELTGTLPTMEQFNELYNSAIAGKPTYVKYGDGTFMIIADYDSITHRGIYHFYYDNFRIMLVFWYVQSGNSTVYQVKSQIARAGDGVREFVQSSKDDIKLHNFSKYTDLPFYYKDYSNSLTAPISTYKGKSATFLLDGKMYYFDEVNGETDGLYTKPTIVDLLNISGGSGGGIEPYIFNIIDTQWEKTPDWDALKAVFDSGKPMIMRYTDTDEGDVNICQVLGWSDTQFWAVGKWAGLSEDGIYMYYGTPERVYCYSKIVLEAELNVKLYEITSQIGDINNILESI